MKQNNLKVTVKYRSSTESERRKNVTKAVREMIRSALKNPTAA